MGLIPFTEFNLKNYSDRCKYLQKDNNNLKIKMNGLKKLHSAKAVLSQSKKKILYDVSLKNKLKMRLIELIDFSTFLDNSLTISDCEKLEVFGQRYGFSIKEIDNIVKEQREKNHFTLAIG